MNEPCLAVVLFLGTGKYGLSSLTHYRNLQLFAGRPTVKKLSLWTDDATFADPLTIAGGRKQYSAQWYGLQAAFSEIKRLSLQVTSSGNPIEMDLKTMYKVKGLGTEQTIDSKVKIFTENEKITRVEDRWNDELPDGAFKNVSMLSLRSWAYYGQSWLYWGWHFCWETWWWRVRTPTGAVIFPLLLRVASVGLA